MFNAFQRASSLTFGLLLAIALITIHAITTVEQPPSQPNGGGFNTSLRVIGGPTGLDLLQVRFLFGVQQPGSFKFYIKAEGIQQPPTP